MKKSFYSLLIEHSKKWTPIFCFCVFLAFSVIFLPGQTKIAETYSAGLSSPDTSLFYTPADLYHMAEAYGSEGRAAYVQARWTFDLAFPIIYTSFLVISISWVEKQVLLEEDNDFRTGNLLPLFAMLFDLLENTCTTLVFMHYPTYSFFLSMLAPFFTLMKWICVSSSFLFLIIMMIWSMVRRRPRK